ncbi:hypothetical protein N7493_011844 [Penicillium malachiteum]|uniref:Uncharacterized protein n=1 Tax=Penicillium malachiteum TaxID=1324776 RepID=A0AAD6HAJ6_9EURO|nr:hypothetical protein N7493_011844 [Penicillium malachiteum]
MSPQNSDGQRRRGRGRRNRPPPDFRHMPYYQNESLNPDRLSPYRQQLPSSSYPSYQHDDQAMDSNYPSYPDFPGTNWYFPVPGQNYHSHFRQPEYETGYQPFEAQDYQRARFAGPLEAMNARTMENFQFQEYPGMARQIQQPVHERLSQARVQNQPVMETRGHRLRRAQLAAQAASERRRLQREQEMRERIRETLRQAERRNAAVERLAARDRELATWQTRHSAAQRPDPPLAAEHAALVEEARRRGQARRREQLQYLMNVQRLDSSLRRCTGQTDLDRQELVTVFEEALYNMGEYAQGYRNYQAPPSLLPLLPFR